MNVYAFLGKSSGEFDFQEVDIGRGKKGLETNFPPSSR